MDDPDQKLISLELCALKKPMNPGPEFFGVITQYCIFGSRLFPQKKMHNSSTRVHKFSAADHKECSVKI